MKIRFGGDRKHGYYFDWLYHVFEIKDGLFICIMYIVVDVSGSRKSKMVDVTPEVYFSIPAKLMQINVLSYWDPLTGNNM